MFGIQSKIMRQAEKQKYMSNNQEKNQTTEKVRNDRDDVISQ